MGFSIGILVFIIGAVVGSFLNVCICRIPNKKSIVTSPSSCGSCGARLTAIDMVPIFSWLLLCGKCRHCKAKVSPVYPIVELLTGLLYLLLYLKFGLGYELLVYATLTALLIVISFIDFRHMLIPNGLIVAGLIVGIVQLAATIFTGVFDHWSNYVIGFFAGGLPLFLIAMFCTYVLGKDAMGGGDVKLMAFAGFIVGWKLTITSFLIGIIFGAIFSVILLATGKKKRGDEIPFGPFLCFGIMASVLFGQDIIHWYMGLI